MFLISKLVARESQDLKTVGFVYLKQVNQRLIVLLGELAFRGDIDNNHALLIFHVITKNFLF